MLVICTSYFCIRPSGDLGDWFMSPMWASMAPNPKTLAVGRVRFAGLDFYEAFHPLVNPTMTRESIYIYIYVEYIYIIRIFRWFTIYSNVCMYVYIYIYVFPRTINHLICYVSARWLVVSFTTEKHLSFCHLPFGSALGANIFWRFIPGHLQLRFTRPSLFSVSKS